MRSFAISTVLLSVLLTSCTTEAVNPLGGEWRGTITTEGNVTTVVNESGSVWGGNARLVEDVCIGVESGDDVYMFGLIDSVGATEDRIYVLDDQLPAVRVYDHSGRHLFDFGGAGGGPGEFNNPVVMAVDPGGRVLVQDLSRINVFDLDGNSIDTWAYPGALIMPPVVAVDGTAFFPHNWGEGGEWHYGLVGIGPDGSQTRLVPSPDYEGAGWWMQARRPDGSLINQVSVPYAPRMNWTVLPSGAAAEGVSDRYRFQVSHPDGHDLVVERLVERVPVSSSEAAWLRDRVMARMRLWQAGSTWDANAIPDHKPTFEDLYGDRHGRIWVHRIAGTEAVTDCDPDFAAASERGEHPRTCWDNRMTFDVFDVETGRFLGGIESVVPAFRSDPVFLRDAVLLVVEDDAGTIMVKRYRLVLPGED